MVFRSIQVSLGLKKSNLRSAQNSLLTRTQIVVDATSLDTKMKGVGRYTWQICKALEICLPEEVGLHLLVFDKELPSFPVGFRGIFHPISYCSELAVGFKRIPRMLKEYPNSLLIRPADKIGKNYRVPTLTVCHDVNPLIWEAQPKRSVRRRLVDAAWERLRGDGLRHSETVVCNSRFIQEAAIRHFGLRREKTTLGYCGVDPRIPRLAAMTDLNFVRARYGGNGFLLTFATGDEREGYQILPELWSAAKKAGYPGGLVVAGVKYEHAYSSALTADFQSLGVMESVHLLPFLGEEELQELAGIYAASDFYLETSRHEGFGMQLVEAMACGTTCFSSGRGALEEIGGGYTIPLAINSPSEAGEAIAAAWGTGEHQRDNRSQVEHALSFDWSQATETIQSWVMKRLAV